MANEPKEADKFTEPTKRPSKAWYLVPIFFGIVGGLVMYLVLKDEDRKMAKKGLVLSIILTVVITIVIFIVSVIFGMLIALSAPSKSLLSPLQCQAYLQSLIKSGYPAEETQKLMARYGCS